MPMPLMCLLLGNLHEARNLGMIDCTDVDFYKYLTEINKYWDCKADQHKEYDKWMQITKQTFDRHFRPLQAFRGRTVPFCNLIPMSFFVKFWLDQLEPGYGDPDAGKGLPT